MILYTVKTKLGERVLSFNDDKADFADKYIKRMFKPQDVLRMVKV
jgi:hypothetical protein